MGSAESEDRKNRGTDQVEYDEHDQSPETVTMNRPYDGCAGGIAPEEKIGRHLWRMVLQDDAEVLPQGYGGDDRNRQGEEGRSTFQNEQNDQRQGDQGGYPTFPVHANSIAILVAKGSASIQSANAVHVYPHLASAACAISENPGQLFADDGS